MLILTGPDLVFGDRIAVGDVKYKISDGEWNRHDLYQVTTFAAGFRAPTVGMFTFGVEAGVALPALQIGSVAVRGFLWNASGEMSPDDAAADVVAQARQWLSSPCRWSASQANSTRDSLSSG
jgi:hypothetical protein